MTGKTRRLDKFAASPVGDKVEFVKLFEAARAKWPALKLGYIGTDGERHFFQVMGDQTEYSVPVSRGWKPHA